MKRTKESLYKGIENAIAGKRVGDIGYAIQSYVESFGYSVVRDLVGHGLGRNLHEKPEVPNFGRRGRGTKLNENLVIAIEPMINLGTKRVVQEKDGWTIRTADRQPSAHYEHDVVVRKGKAEILSTFDYIEEVLNNK
jgi:methionyl aminopeptidase